MQTAILYNAVKTPDDARKIFGLQVATTDWLKAFLRYSKQEKFPFLIGTVQALEEVQEAMAALGMDPQRLLAYDSRFPQENLGNFDAVFRPDPDCRHILWQRAAAPAARFAFCGLAHAVAGWEIGELLEQYCLAPADGNDAIVCPSHAVKAAIRSFWDIYGEYLEQRFGVKAKERLKQYRLLVDVLTLTATPIPRTLYMALSGARDMSVISTPPQNRIPVSTHIVHFDEKLIKDAIERELRRKGQVFFLHNRVEDIDQIGNIIKRLVGHARISVAHGQMPGKLLEEIMIQFLSGEIDVLVCTSIIESGIDIPNANTLIINRADRFGLSELHQLRGRVGRMDVKAYAYFVVPPEYRVSDIARKRLEAIEKHSDLGAGFQIAFEDLQIRGAGNLLGQQQHGFISAIGFDLYCRLLKQSIEHLKKKITGQKNSDHSSNRSFKT